MIGKPPKPLSNGTLAIGNGCRPIKGPADCTTGTTCTATGSAIDPKN